MKTINCCLLIITPLALAIANPELLAGAQPKGAEILMIHPPKESPQDGKAEATSSRATVATTVKTMDSYGILLSADSEDSMLMFEEAIREADGTVRVESLLTEKPGEYRFRVHGFFGSVDTLQKHLENTMKRALRTGLAGGIIDPAGLPFTNATFTNKDDVLEVKLVSPPTSSKSAPLPPTAAPVVTSSPAPAPSFATNPASLATLVASPRPGIPVDAVPRLRYPALQNVRYSAAPGKIIHATHNIGDDDERPRFGTTSIVIAAGMVLILLPIFSVVGAWVCARMVWKWLFRKRCPIATG